ncbi:MAG: ADP/ATP-dependent (S)-NAD(P)H-hydrate dehydratase [Cryobacterium sp.]
MINAPAFTPWQTVDAAAWIARPRAGDDKYSRGVLGIGTGSVQYPGAAVLGVQAAARTGLGMIRYRGPEAAAQLVLQRRPEAVVGPGRVQAWLLGSGINADDLDPGANAMLQQALGDRLPTVCDAGALDLVLPRLIGAVRADTEASGQSAPHLTVITPHFRELAGLLGRAAARGIDTDGPAPSPEEVARAPEEWAARAAGMLGVTVLLKGAVTLVASPGGIRLRVSGAPAWLATAGSGDVLGGILGALLATHSEQVQSDPRALPALAATAAWIHADAARRASQGGPIAALDVADAVPRTIAALLAGTGTGAGTGTVAGD